jgi:hypothetical protein
MGLASVSNREEVKVMSFARFSLRSIFIWTAIIAVCLVCLIRPSFARAVLFFSGTLLALAVAVVGSVSSHGRPRMFWLGFAICGGGHFLLALAPWWQDDISGLLLSSQALEWFGGLIGFDFSSRIADRLNVWHALLVPASVGGPNWLLDDFMVIGHCQFSLLLGWLGGLLGTYFHQRRENPLVDNAASKSL